MYRYLLLPLILYSVCVNSQDIPVQSPDIPWCNTQNVSVLPSVMPPIAFDMPLKAAYGYLFLDSLCRITSRSSWDVADSIDQMISTISVDSLFALLSYIYAAKDYDPVLFRMYRTFGDYLNPSYQSPPGFYFDRIVSGCDKRFFPSRRDDLLVSLCDGIFEIEIIETSQDERERLYYGSKSSYANWMCIKAKVLSSMKGRKLLFGCLDEGKRDSCIYIQFRRGQPAYRRGDEMYGRIVDSIGVDSVGNIIYQPRDYSSATPVYGLLSGYTPGSRYFIFIKIGNTFHVGNHIVYTYNHPYLNYSRDGGIFVVDETVSFVRDRDNIFGLGTSIPIDDFRSMLVSKIESFINFILQ